MTFAFINAFGVLWVSLLWALASLLAGILAALPIYFIAWSSNGRDVDGATQFTAFIVSVIVLFGMLVGGYLEIEQQYKKSQNNKQAQFLNQKVLSVNFLDKKSKTSSAINIKEVL